MILLNANFFDRLTPTVLTLLLALHLLFFARKSRAALHLGGFFSFLTLFNFGYLWAFALDIPVGRYGFYLACFITLALVFKLQFAYHMPENHFPRESRFVFFLSIIVSIAAILEYSIVAENTPFRFFFDNHIYGSVYASPYVPLTSMIMFFGVMIVFLRQIRLIGKQQGVSLWGCLFFPHQDSAIAVRSFLLLALAELVINVLYMISTLTDFVTARTINQLFNLGLMFVYFFYFIVYINHSRESTSLMVRLVGISLVTLLVATSLLGSRSIQRIEDSYDAQNLSAINALILNEHESLPPKASYVASIPSTRRFQESYRILSGNDWSAEVLQISDAERKSYLIQKRASKIVGEKQVSEIEALSLAKDEISEMSRRKGGRDYRNTNRGRFIIYTEQLRDSWLEFGFPYTGYRKTIHDSVLEYSALVLFLTFLLLLLFPFFFSSSLIRPLNSLLSGVKEVNAGDLSVQVPVKVRDEIGFLAESFNGMVQSIREARMRLQDYADNLEGMVQERTRELNDSNQALEEAKAKQDGDYFLTSLLLSPLVHNDTAEGLAKVDFLLKQKKEFTFRRWHSEIGGDYCVADRIQLEGTDYTVFLNADAMGKSIQGGGGILVLGSLFKAMLHRSHLSGTLQNYSPERWIKTAYEEMNSVFRGFDGSMLVSFAMGLLDETTGVVYFVQAEHPAGVIFENGKARFLSLDDQLMKLGTPTEDRPLRIKVFRLNPGQVFIMGSDGRDDILVDSGDGPKMNTDERKFLEVVERSNGNLKAMHEVLKSKGEISDDLSLMSISFDGKSPDHRVVTTQLKEAIQKEDWSLAAILAIRRVSLIPEDSDFLLSASRACRKGGRLMEAIDLGERLVLRVPERTDNLKHLIRLCIMTGNFARGQQLLTALERQAANDSSLPGLRAALETNSRADQEEADTFSELEQDA